MGSCIFGGGQCHTRLLVLGEGEEGDMKLIVFTFDLITLSISIN